MDVIEQKRIEMLKHRHLHGHSSDSRMQDIIYKKNGSHLVQDQLEIDAQIRSKKIAKFTGKETRISEIDFDEIVVPYQVNFEFSDQIGQTLLNKTQSRIVNSNLSRMDLKISEIINSQANDHDHFEDKDCELRPELATYPNSDELFQQIFAFNYINLEEILARLLFKPVQIQSEIVNKCLLNYFLFDLNLEEHLMALRMYMFCENSEFSQIFIDELCENVFFSASNHSNVFLFENQLNPIYLAEALDKAISSTKGCKYIENFSIRLDYDNEKRKQLDNSKNNSLQRQILMFLNCLELKYKLNWPLNIVITENCLESYNKIFEFFLQIKLILTTLNYIWHTLKRFGLNIFIRFLYFLISFYSLLSF